MSESNVLHAAGNWLLRRNEARSNPTLEAFTNLGPAEWALVTSVTEWLKEERPPLSPS